MYLRKILYVDEFGLESCPVVNFGISCFQTSYTTARELAGCLTPPDIIIDFCLRKGRLKIKMKRSE